ncbi:RNA-directed DNA polymerase, eukaryota, reverse transcriptase zinc-binding domain protein [Tanacetum coccineum]
MDTNRRSSKRKQKIPNHLIDSVHELNKKKESGKSKGNNGKNKNGKECLDQAVKECLDQAVKEFLDKNVSQNGLFEELAECKDSDTEGLMESGEREGMMMRAAELGDEGTSDVNEQSAGKVGPILEQVIADETVIADSADKVNMGVENDFVSHKHHDEVEIEIPNVSTPDSNKQYVSSSITSPIRATYAAMTSSNAKLDRNLDFEPTLTEDGNEFVIFDEDLSKMNVGPWMVNGKPFIVQKWNPDVSLDKPEPDKLPLWVKMFNVPLEAWNKKGISKLASSVGNPLVMDEMPANMCQYGRGRIGYARVLVEVDARKKFKEGFEKNQMRNVIVRKDVNKEAFTDVRGRQYQQNNMFRRNQQNNAGRGHIVINNEGQKGRKKSKQSSNKYVVLADCNEEENGLKLNQEQKNKWEDGNDIEHVDNDDEHVIEDLSGTCFIDNKLEGMEEGAWNIRGIGTLDKQNEIQKLILENKLSIFAILETRAKDLNFQKQVVNGKPWILLGDFNVTLFSHEHSAGSSTISQDMQDFKECVDTNELNDICSSGFQFTWTKSPSNPINGILKKLDIVLSNEEFISSFEQAHAVFLPYIIFDHSPSMVVIPGVLKKNKNLLVVKAMKPLKKSMNRLNWKNGNLFEKVIQLRDKLKEWQAKLDRDPFNVDIKKEEAQILLEYKDALIDENGRKHLSRVESICDEHGKRFYGDEVPELLVNHFQQFLGKEGNTHPMVGIQEMFINRLSKEEAIGMIQQVTDDEIKHAMFDIDNDKATGPDGYTACFFKKSWSIVGKDIIEAIKEFFLTGKLLKEVNATLISLILKMATPNKFSDFGPIACCNVLYKCISKIITNRIKSGLDKVVSLNQSAFIPGRSIQDNILMTQELLKGYKSKNGPQRCALKIELQKAYDTVSWAFLEEILRQFGFHDQMVGWIMTYVSSSAFSICVNGQVHGYFKGAKGLRQGDPSSPYLFTLVMEVLNLILIKNIEAEGNFKYHAGCKELKITHLCFADDLMVFCHGDSLSISIVKNSLIQQLFWFASQFEEEHWVLPMKYLGVPLLAKCLGVNDCKSLIEKVKNKIGDWKNMFLSYAGRVQLISSVLASMQTYWASVYLIPKTVVKEIDKVMKKKLWDNKGNNSGRAKIAWKVVCRPKDQGGLGIKPLGEWNETLLIKNIWKIVVQSQSLWVKWVNRMKLKGRSVWDIENDDGDSWGWRKLMELRNKIRPHVFHNIGNGKSTSIWYDRWNQCGPLSNIINRRDIYDARLKTTDCVANMIEEERWKWPSEWLGKFPVLREIKIPILNQNQDQIVWINSKGRHVKFTIRDVWMDMRSQYDKVDWHHIIWFSQCTPRYSFTMWLALHRRLQTQDVLSKWINVNVLHCPLCSKTSDSVPHLIFECDYSKRLKLMHYKNNIKSILRKVGVAACVYAIWRERNLRIFQDMQRPVVTKEITEDIKWKLSSFIVKRSKVVSEVYEDWNTRPSYAK